MPVTLPVNPDIREDFLNSLAEKLRPSGGGPMEFGFDPAVLRPVLDMLVPTPEQGVMDVVAPAPMLTWGAAKNKLLDIATKGRGGIEALEKVGYSAREIRKWENFLADSWGMFEPLHEVPWVKYSELRPDYPGAFRSGKFIPRISSVKKYFDPNITESRGDILVKGRDLIETYGHELGHLLRPHYRQLFRRKGVYGPEISAIAHAFDEGGADAFSELFGGTPFYRGRFESTKLEHPYMSGMLYGEKMADEVAAGSVPNKLKQVYDDSLSSLLELLIAGSIKR